MSGKEQSRVLVMIDGIPLNKSDGGTVNWNQLDPDEIERIEVVKGPVSSLYGGNAMGGAINMISRVPVKELSGKITTEYGTYNTRSLRGNLNGLFRQGKNKNLSLYWGMNAFRRTSDGYITQSEADQAANPYITASTVDEWGAGGKIGMTIRQNHRAEISLSRFDDFRGMGEVVFQEFGNITEHDAWLGSAKYMGTIGKVKINSALYFYDEDYKKVNEYMKDDYTFYKVLSNRLDKGFFTSLFFPLHESHKITTGVDYKIGSVDASDVYYTSTDIVDNAGKMQTFGFFLQDEKSFLDEKIRVILGFRTDYARFYDGNFILHSPTRETEFMTGYAVNNKDGEPWLAFSPKISGMYRPAANTRYYVSWARGFRPSVLDDLCRSGRVRGGFKVANTDLKPEYISSFEAGIDHNLSEKLEIRGTGFLSLGKDFLYYVNTGDSIDMGFGGRPIYVRSNISGVRIIGLETELNYNLRKDMRISVSYTFNDARITNYTPMASGDTIDLTNNFLTDVPAHSALATFTWSGKPVHISLVARYLGKRFINDLNAYDDIVLSDRYPDYFTLDIRIQKKILKYILAGAEVQNLLDTKFYDSKGAVCPGRFITCFIGLKF
jgi:iron complex outermembrane receptor protein